jgi:hypothetical protein
MEDTAVDDLEEGEEEELTEEDLTEDLEDIYNNLDEPR